MTPIIGIDPGKTGAIALYNPVTGVVQVEDVPLHILKRGKAAKNHVDVLGVARIIDWMLAGPITPIVVIESVGARPGEAAAYAFDFGQTTGILLGVCAAHFPRIERVTPAVWKRDLKVPAAKDGARARASQLLPRASHLWTRVKDDGRAEAALIALWGSLFLVGENNAERA